jgi:hypothetical protein
MKSLQESIKRFNKRWKIPYDDRIEFTRFQSRVLLSFDKHLDYILSNTSLGTAYMKLVGLPPLSSKELRPLDESYKPVKFHDTEIWYYISHVSDLRELVRCVQCVFWLEPYGDPDELEFWDWGDKMDAFFESITTDINISRVPVNANRSNDILFYPKGAKLLDQKLVNDVLDWLPTYSPKSRQYFESALSEYLTKHYRDSIDKMRVSLETFMRHLLRTRKSLENQKSLLGTYLENKKVPSDMRNAYSAILYQYTVYQNNVAKHPHDRNAPEPTEDEAEFIIYQTGLLMRFLIQLDSRQITNS